MSSGCPRVTKSALGPQSKPPVTDGAQGRRRPAVPTAGGQLDGCEEQPGGTAASGNAQTNLGDKGSEGAVSLKDNGGDSSCPCVGATPSLGKEECATLKQNPSGNPFTRMTFGWVPKPEDLQASEEGLKGSPRERSGH